MYGVPLGSRPLGSHLFVGPFARLIGALLHDPGLFCLSLLDVCLLATPDLFSCSRQLLGTLRRFERLTLRLLGTLGRGTRPGEPGVDRVLAGQCRHE